MSLLTIVQNAQIECGTPVASSAFNSTDPITAQMVRLAYNVGKDLTLRWTWLTGKSSGTFTGDGTTPTFSLPVDLQTLNPSDTFVSSIYPTLPMRGPVNEDELLRLKALPVVTLPSYWRRIGTQIEFYPPLALNEVVSYVYASKYWITDATGATAKASWTADTDIARIDEDLITAGVVWQFKRAKGLAYTDWEDRFELMLDSITGQENTERTIRMSDNIGPDWLNSALTLTVVSASMLILKSGMPFLLSDGTPLLLLSS